MCSSKSDFSNGPRRGGWPRSLDSCYHQFVLFEAAPSTAPDASGQSLAEIGTKSSSVYAQAICVLKALRKAGEARLLLMGWTDDEWNAARRRSEAHEAALVRAFTAVQP
jgi:hypothetical protein